VAEAQSIANSTSLTLTSFQISEVTLLQSSSQKQSSFDFTITATGTYPNILNFLSQIANFQRVVALKAIILSTENGNLQLSLNGTVFFKQ
jgi:Tfp pilus assembly protein PilO